MKYLSEKEYHKELERIKRFNKQLEYRQVLQNEKEKMRPRKKIATSKLIAIYLFALLNVIVIYAMVAMWHFMNLSYLGVLITDIAGQVLIYGIYCLKAYKGKKSEEDLKFEREKYEDSISQIILSGSECNDYVPIQGANNDVQ